MAWACMSCDDPSIQHDSSLGYFVKTESLITTQAQSLDLSSPEVAKSILANGQGENHNTHDVDWEKELAVFKELDISKPGLQHSYSITQPDSHTRLYTLKSDEHGKVQWLKVIFGNDSTQIRSLEGLIKQTNYLYQSEKLLQISFHPNRQGEESLAGYQIESRNKILFGSEETLKIKGEIAH